MLATCRHGVRVGVLREQNWYFRGEPGLVFLSPGAKAASLLSVTRGGARGCGVHMVAVLSCALLSGCSPLSSCVVGVLRV